MEGDEAQREIGQETGSQQGREPDSQDGPTAKGIRCPGLMLPLFKNVAFCSSCIFPLILVFKNTALKHIFTIGFFGGPYALLLRMSGAPLTLLPASPAALGHF